MRRHKKSPDVDFQAEIYHSRGFEPVSLNILYHRFSQIDNHLIIIFRVLAVRRQPKMSRMRSFGGVRVDFG